MQRSLSHYQIKLLAALFMVIDHVGVLFFPDVYLFRAIGRLSFPLFIWLLVQGEAHTRNVWNYALRLVASGIVSQLIYVPTFDSQQLNILFTLSVGLFCLRIARITPWIGALGWIAGAALATSTDMEYGWYGIAAIALIRYFKPNLIWGLMWCGLHIGLAIVFPSYGQFQFPVIFTPLIFLLANGEQGAKARWFYLFYPLHLLILFLLRQQI